MSDPDSVMTLAEPIHFATEKYSVIIQDAFLSSDHTFINYLVFEGTSSENQIGQGCLDPVYLTVSGADKKFFEISRGIFDVLPGGTDTVILNIPCLTSSKNDGIGSIPLTFKESVEKNIAPESDTAEVAIADGASGIVRVVQVFLEQDEIILIAELSSRDGVNEYFHISGVPILQDSDGKFIDYETPLGSNVSAGNQKSSINYNFKFSSSGIKFPLTVRFSVKLTEKLTEDLYAGRSEDWSVKWSPVSADLSKGTTACITAENIMSLKSAPILPNAEYLVRQTDGAWAVFDGLTKSTVVANDASDVKISPDHKNVAIVYPDRFVIKDLSNGEEINFQGEYSPKIFWNTDSNLVALQLGKQIGVYSVDGDEIASIPIPQGSLLAGWISSESLLYGTPERSGRGSLLRFVNINDQVSMDLFYLDHSAGKNINLSVSPDGLWIAYRGEKQATLFIKGLASEKVKQIINAASTMINPTATNNFFWSNDGSGLIIEVKLPDEEGFEPFFVDIESCNFNRVPDLSGKIMEVQPKTKSN